MPLVLQSAISPKQWIANCCSIETKKSLVRCQETPLIIRMERGYVVGGQGGGVGGQGAVFYPLEEIIAICTDGFLIYLPGGQGMTSGPFIFPTEN